MEIMFTTTETKVYQIEVPDKYFKQLSNPQNRKNLLKELAEAWKNPDENRIAEEWVDFCAPEYITNKEAQQITEFTDDEKEFFYQIL
jgi:hypothetical protein